MKNVSKKRNPESRELIRSLKSKYLARRSFTEKLSDWITVSFGTIKFLVLNIIFFAVWIGLNTGIIPGFRIFDPFPYSFLTMIVSLEAIILSLFVLISENRSEKIDNLRDEVDLKIDIVAEKELTKLLDLNKLILKKMGVNVSRDRELITMLRPVNEKRMEKTLEKEM